MGSTIKYSGISHVALVCDDMARTVEFYTKVMDMPLVKAMEVSNGRGQHFFFDVGNGDCLAFFWFKDVRPAMPGIAAPAWSGDESANGSMNHLAFKVERERLAEYAQRFTDIGIEFVIRVHNLERPTVYRLEDISEDSTAASIYLMDPDGIEIELCAWLPAWERVGNEIVPMTRPTPTAPRLLETAKA